MLINRKNLIALNLTLTSLILAGCAGGSSSETPPQVAHAEEEQLQSDCHLNSKDAELFNSTQDRIYVHVYAGSTECREKAGYQIVGLKPRLTIDLGAGDGLRAKLIPHSEDEVRAVYDALKIPYHQRTEYFEGKGYYWLQIGSTYVQVKMSKMESSEGVFSVTLTDDFSKENLQTLFKKNGSAKIMFPIESGMLIGEDQAEEYRWSYRSFSEILDEMKEQQSVGFKQSALFRFVNDGSFDVPDAQNDESLRELARVKANEELKSDTRVSEIAEAFRYLMSGSNGEKRYRDLLRDYHHSILRFKGDLAKALSFARELNKLGQELTDSRQVQLSALARRNTAKLPDDSWAVSLAALRAAEFDEITAQFIVSKVARYQNDEKLSRLPLSEKIAKIKGMVKSSDSNSEWQKYNSVLNWESTNGSVSRDLFAAADELVLNKQIRMSSLLAAKQAYYILVYSKRESREDALQKISKATVGGDFKKELVK
jgi:hypothetical protein